MLYIISPSNHVLQQKTNPIVCAYKHVTVDWKVTDLALIFRTTNYLRAVLVADEVAH
jgi:hypothetical protein